MQAIIFLAPLAFNLTLEEDPKVNRLVRALPYIPFFSARRLTSCVMGRAGGFDHALARSVHERAPGQDDAHPLPQQGQSLLFPPIFYRYRYRGLELRGLVRSAMRWRHRCCEYHCPAARSTPIPPGNREGCGRGGPRILQPVCLICFVGAGWGGMLLIISCWVPLVRAVGLSSSTRTIWSSRQEFHLEAFAGAPVGWTGC